MKVNGRILFFQNDTHIIGRMFNLQFCAVDSTSVNGT